MHCRKESSENYNQENFVFYSSVVDLISEVTAKKNMFPSVFY